MRTPHAEFAGLPHLGGRAGADPPESLAEAVNRSLEVVEVLETNRRFTNVSPYGETQLGRRGLYRSASGAVATPDDERALLWVLNQSDGLGAAEHRARLGPYAVLRRAAERLQ
jgi:aminopeptidase-like protein